ncbi:GntR family transcriptional regulator [Ectobacillus sp. JY-23]|uniref:GntR family transcriptional regulator n=1 Tax=Ectobacillus sp. JY-23 TaxID=2933872 RepID=UPI001FF6CC99|nr:GntR family transcriptional regulator [Ectobacillus sp. JY-23]UOY92553.1 GntR family transcriptional regulator [Ectobacillus sp. JY-23]
MNNERSSTAVESILIQRITQGVYQAGQPLSSERELAALFSTSRATIREALQRLQCDGWVTLQSRQPAIVNDYWKQGNIGTLVDLARHGDSEVFISHLLELRIVLVPAYVRDAIHLHRARAIAILSDFEIITDEAASYATFDWHLQKQMAMLSSNPLYLLLLNSFEDVYLKMAQRYFAHAQHRDSSREYYEKLLEACFQGNAEEAALVTREAMQKSLMLWRGVYEESL